MDIKGFKTKDGTVHEYDYNALANVPKPGETPSQGGDGGYYTPSVTQPETNKLQFAFTPSKADMPAVEPVQVTLPVGQGSGGNVDYVGVEPAEDDMPKIFVTGVKPTTKDDVLAEMEYVSKTDKFHAYLEIKCQGTSSMSYPKKNFTVKLYSDEARETKLKKSFKDWNHESNKFVLKANYIDHAHARNIVSARLWGEIVASRPDYTSLPEEMRNAPNNGAVDGFPIKVYYNGNYEGVYTWNIGKDDWMWGMDEDNVNHVLLCAEGNTDGTYAETPSNFRALWNGIDGSKPGWSVEVGTNSTALKTSLNNLIQFVMDNDGDAFRNGIGNYLDIQSAIDYYIFQYEICGLDGLAHNMLLATYDGVVWRCGAYDLDATFGLYWNGSKFVSAQYRCPEDYQEAYSLLWERIEANFAPELKARQAELRKTVLSYSNIVTHFERFMDIIGLDLYAEDLTVYTGIPSGSTNNIKQIRDYIRDRHTYVDAEFAAMAGELPDPDQPDTPDNPEPSVVPCTGISLDKTELTFDGEGTQTITATVTPNDTTDSVVWVSSDPTVASITVDGNVCTVRSVRNGNTVVTVTCGNYAASCSVTVSGITTLYKLASPTTFNGVDDYIDTGVSLFDTDKDFTVCVEFAGSGNSFGAVIHCINEQDQQYPGIIIYNNENSYSFNAANDIGVAKDSTEVQRYVITKNATAGDITLFRDNGAFLHINGDKATSMFDGTLYLGCKRRNSGLSEFWSGTINKLEVYDRTFTVDESFEWLGISNTEPLYALKNGVFTDSACDIEVENDNVVRLKRIGGHQAFAIISDVSLNTYTGNSSNCTSATSDTLFSIQAGDEIQTILIPVGNASLGNRSIYADTGVGGDLIKISKPYNATYNNFITAASNADVKKICMFSENNGGEDKFELRIYVNGVRYI